MVSSLTNKETKRERVLPFFVEKEQKMKSYVENVDNCCGNYSHFYSLFIEKRVKNGEEKGRIVEKKGKSTTTFQKLWITF